MTPLLVTDERSIDLASKVDDADGRILLVALRNGDVDEPAAKDLFRVGTVAHIHRIIRVPDGSVRVLVQGIERVRIGRITRNGHQLQATVSPLPDKPVGKRKQTESDALTRQLQNVFSEIVEHANYLPDELRLVSLNVNDPSELCHLIASTVGLQIADRQNLLEAVDVVARLRELLRLLAHELEVLQLGSKIQDEVHTEISKTQREWFLRQQLKQIEEELGGGESSEIGELRMQLEQAALPSEARKQATRELERLARTPEQAAEHGVIRSYLEWVAELPWNTESEDRFDLDEAKVILDRDHYGLDEVKERILDHLAVARLKRDAAGPILCLVGPPGVGKTSLGRSIAEALGRSFARISVGGVRDESEIRGHRRTYVGSMPGSVLRSLRDAGTRNPVFMVDEIDKMGNDWRGDPASAMLEVLDPEQNVAFRDHYLDLPFDLSRALFVCTANRTDTIPPALRDRMELIHIEGYTELDKLAIARRHLLPRQLRDHGLKARSVSVKKPVLQSIVRNYTREAGVRELDRMLARVSRKVARQVAEGVSGTNVVEPEELLELLGPVRYTPEDVRRTLVPGVAPGLAVTNTGGDVLYIEAAAVPGKGKLTITGHIGQVMQESAQAALSWLRMELSATDPDAATALAEMDVHIHVPSGAMPKDGPSAGIAMATALASLVHGTSVRTDIAMTGEITLTGRVLPIGGVKEKALAAQRAGIHHIIIPERNEGDLYDLPDELARTTTFHLVDEASQVLELAFTAKRNGNGNGMASARKRAVERALKARN
jgi:ATP-dependent Lon protease